MNENHTLLNVATEFEAIPVEKRAMIPYAAILKANAEADWSRFTYGVREANNVQWMDLAANFDATKQDKTSLRSLIDGLLVKIDNDEALWKQDKWAAVALTAEDAKTAYLAGWEASPLEVQNALFVDAGAPCVNDFSARNSNVYKSGEDLLAHFEPKNFAWKQLDDGGFRLALNVDFALLNEKGEIMIEKLKGLGELSAVSRGRQTEFQTETSIGFGRLPAGS